MGYNIDQCISYTMAHSTSITDIISTRHYPIILPQNATYPALTWKRVIELEHHNIGFNYPRFQFDCWAQTFGEARALAKEIKDCFQRRNEPIGGTSGLRIVRGVLEGDLDLYDVDTKVYHSVIDIKIIYKE